ncbi:coiled-coil domain-containing protein 172 isoform X2 [Amia ocellicauda]|uniref:coiled-coil domain-containing protein 172 isoform X2 n=1 Tax=Amia ocellicauda TaxID=2972642 RepID=UPI0034649A05
MYRQAFEQVCDKYIYENVNKMSLDSLCRHILLTGQQATEKRRLQREVKAEINKWREQIKAATEDLDLAKNHLDEKDKILSETVLQFQLLKKHEDSAEKQKAELLNQQCNLIETLEKIRQKTSEEKEKFFKEITDFNNKYNLLSNREAVVESRAKSEILRLEQEERSLNTEMESMEQRNIQLNSLQAEKRALQSQLAGLEHQMRELERKLNEAKMFTESLRAEELKISRRPQIDSEFVRLKKELEGYKDGELESTREALHSEIHFLQMKLSQRDPQSLNSCR